MNQSVTKKLVFVFFSVVLSTGYAFSQNNWQPVLDKLAEEAKLCTSGNCYEYLAKALDAVYGSKEFMANGNYLTYQAIASKASKEWQVLGKAYEQAALNKAQELANAGTPVLAVLNDKENIGQHVVLIIPGQNSPSGSWGLQVPNCASFFTAQPEKSFSNKGLSYAFTKGMIMNVSLYAKQ